MDGNVIRKQGLFFFEKKNQEIFIH